MAKVAEQRLLRRVDLDGVAAISTLIRQNLPSPQLPPCHPRESIMDPLGLVGLAITGRVMCVNALLFSGSEDFNGYVWSRDYGCLLGLLGHKNVVNSVAFNPKDPEMLVSASDDWTVKVWRSKRRSRMSSSSSGLNEDEMEVVRDAT